MMPLDRPPCRTFAERSERNTGDFAARNIRGTDHPYQKATVPDFICQIKRSEIGNANCLGGNVGIFRSAAIQAQFGGIATRRPEKFYNPISLAMINFITSLVPP